MKYNDAKKLHNGDEITIKDTGKNLTVINVYEPRPLNLINRKNIIVLCDDENEYHHTNIK